MGSNPHQQKHHNYYCSTHFVGIRPPIGHRQPSPTIMLIVGMEFVRKGHVVAPNGGFVSGNVRRVAALYHKATDVAMKDGPIVFAGCRQGQKVKGGTGTGITKDFAFQVAHCGVDSNRHDVSISGSISIVADDRCVAAGSRVS